MFDITILMHVTQCHCHVHKFIVSVSRILQKVFNLVTGDVSVMVCQILQDGCHICYNNNYPSVRTAVTMFVTRNTHEITVFYILARPRLASVLCYSRDRETRSCYRKVVYGIFFSCSSADPAFYYKAMWHFYGCNFSLCVHPFISKLRIIRAHAQQLERAVWYVLNYST